MTVPVKHHHGENHRLDTVGDLFQRSNLLNVSGEKSNNRTGAYNWHKSSLRSERWMVPKRKKGMEVIS